MRKFLLSLLLSACAPLPAQLSPEELREAQAEGVVCTAVAVSETRLATVSHCDSANRKWVDHDAGLALLGGQNLKPAILAIRPVASEMTCTLRSRKFRVVDPLLLSEGHFYLRTRQQLNKDDSGYGLWCQGQLAGIALGNDGKLGVFIHAGEIARALIDE